MWKAIGDALAGNNGLTVAILIVVVAVLIFVCARLGIIKIHTDKVSVGKDASDMERTIMRYQTEFVYNALYGFEAKIPKFEGYDKYRGRYIIERILDEIVKWITYNHLENTKTYIGIKQDIIWNLVQSYVVADEMKTNEFKKEVDDHIRYVIENLITIREEYEK